MQILNPVFRHGTDTPWGGTALRDVFSLKIPDETTGEALIASTLPALGTACADGRLLSDVAGELPLLLKLIDARESLSVQLHPSDENLPGRGKAEAWIVLAAQPNAELVLGLLPGTDAARLHGKDWENALRKVRVNVGDMFYIPPGTVHAIGAGLLLYEIQQTSDVTYRLWDWGRPRPLHEEEARQCLDVASRPEAVSALNTPYFWVQRVQVPSTYTGNPHSSFRYITALSDVKINRTKLPAGHTAYIAPGEGFTLEGAGEVLVAGGRIR